MMNFSYLNLCCFNLYLYFENINTIPTLMGSTSSKLMTSVKIKHIVPLKLKSMFDDPRLLSQRMIEKRSKMLGKTMKNI